MKKIKYCSIAAVLAVIGYSGLDYDSRTSRSGLELIGKYEGCSFDSYYCPAGVLTDGVGNTTDVRDGKTMEEIAVDFINNVKKSEYCVIRYFNGENMPQPVFDAVTSLVFNVGCYGTRWNSSLQRPTSIAMFANKNDWLMVCEHILDFNKSGGKVLNGLVNRRQEEYRLCIRFLE